MAIFYYFQTSFVVVILQLSSNVHSKMFMPGEPLNPNTFEKALEPSTAVPYDMDKLDDGTYNDIIQPRTRGGYKNIRGWPNGVIPYLIDKDMTEEDRVIIARALTIFHNNTCIRVVARSNEEDYIIVKKNLKGRSCSSHVGMMGGPQTTTLAERCIKRPGSIIHEFMHVAGFFHEQGRPDRDEYIIVHSDNIRPGALGNFNKISGSYANSPEYGQYDTLSITHYGRKAFAIDHDKDSMTPKEGDQLGQRDGLTKYDIEKINSFYNCPQAEQVPGDIVLVPKPPLMPSDEPRPIPQGPGQEPGSSRTLDSSGNSEKNSSRFTFGDLIPMMCKDFDQLLCSKLARYKYCKVNPMFMDVFCKKTCKTCMGCRDVHPNCNNWAKKKYCRKYEDYMTHYCSKSCNRCVV